MRRCSLTTPREGQPVVRPDLWKPTRFPDSRDYPFQVSRAAFIKLAGEANAQGLSVFRWFRVKAERLLTGNGCPALTISAQPCNRAFVVNLRDDIYNELAGYFSERQRPVDSIAEVIAGLNI